GRPIYEPPRFLSASAAAQQLLLIVERRGKYLTPDSVCVAVARVGAGDQKIAVATLEEMTHQDLGQPLHSLVIPGQMHPLEMQMLRLFAVSDHARQFLLDKDR
ncbi:unnamed protein product, partial [Candidula unifasciata]